MFRKFISYYKPYKGIFIFDLLSALALSFVALLFPMMIRNTTKNIELGNYEIIMPTVLIMAGLAIIYTLASFFLSYQGHMMGVKIENDMRQELFEHYQTLSHDFYDNHKVGALMSRLTGDLYNIGEFAHHFPEDMVITTVRFFGAIIMMVSINPTLAFYTSLIIPAMILFGLITSQYMNRAYNKNREIMSDINASTEETLSGIRVVKSFANESFEIKQFKKLGDRFVKGKKTFHMSEILFYEVLDGFIMLIPVILLGFGGFALYQQSIDLADFLAFFLLISNFTEPIQKIMHSIILFQDGTSGFRRFQEYLNIKPTIQEQPNAMDFMATDGAIVFDAVTFRYDDTMPNVLTNLSFSVNPGEFVAIVGVSGAGKSTLTSLIPRFYDVNEGAIYIDSVDVRSMTLKSLRNNIGIVQQDVYLFSGTVFDNIAYGLTGASFDDVVAAAKKANAHDFIMGLVNGYDTDIGHRGVKLSGGQKQRISIARVFLKNPKILIFDEATSSLDNESERIVQAATESLAQDRTTLVIAHRLSTIKNADRILVIDGCTVVEEGNHEQLLNAQGIYASLHHNA